MKNPIRHTSRKSLRKWWDHDAVHRGSSYYGMSDYRLEITLPTERVMGRPVGGFHSADRGQNNRGGKYDEDVGYRRITSTDLGGFRIARTRK